MDGITSIAACIKQTIEISSDGLSVPNSTNVKRKRLASASYYGVKGALSQRAPGRFVSVRVATANVNTLMPEEQDYAKSKAIGILVNGSVQLLERMFFKNSIQLLGMHEGRCRWSDVRRGLHYVHMCGASDYPGNLGGQIWLHHELNPQICSWPLRHASSLPEYPPSSLRCMSLHCRGSRMPFGKRWRITCPLLGHFIRRVNVVCLLTLMPAYAATVLAWALLPPRWPTIMSPIHDISRPHPNWMH